ncbi:hypothetical protein DPMN_158975 [Dreissena polymorpha]|uniref:Uncharacterized protein n=1 Tax=Dreissena polymorpha TaxID=45954 RepID=A0A9D4EJX4_DREPO|nr:hypothetical protein DPMN_158975 [Dreissena polymorpha]
MNQCVYIGNSTFPKCCGNDCSCLDIKHMRICDRGTPTSACCGYFLYLTCVCNALVISFGTPLKYEHSDDSVVLIETL